ncbi:MAG: hypothetical protein Q8Q02_00305 [Nocardioides sp.]|nr:hypothetical protein [Nocardioides sp.]
MRSLLSPLSVTVAAVAAALVLASCGSDEPAEDTAPSSTSTPADDPAETDPTEEAAPEEAAPEEEPDEAAGNTLEVTVEGDSLSPNGAEMSLSVGDELVLEITSDRAGELHVHARPETYVQFGPGRTTERIVFENPGTVEIEDHDTGFVIALVQVR